MKKNKILNWVISILSLLLIGLVTGLGVYFGTNTTNESKDNSTVPTDTETTVVEKYVPQAKVNIKYGDQVLDSEVITLNHIVKYDRNSIHGRYINLGEGFNDLTVKVNNEPCNSTPDACSVTNCYILNDKAVVCFSYVTNFKELNIYTYDIENYENKLSGFDISKCKKVNDLTIDITVAK